MYKILIRNREIDSVNAVDKFSYYQENDKDFETDDKTVVSNKVNDLLDVYLRKDIQLVEVFEIKTEVISEIPDSVVIDSSVDENIKPENIKKGIKILGVTGIYEGEPPEDEPEE